MSVFRKSMLRRSRMGLCQAVAMGAVATMLVAGPQVAMAQSAGAQPATYSFDIPAQSVSRSVAQIASVAKLQVLYNDDLGEGQTARAVRGRMTADQALAQVLAGTGYRYQYTQPGVITLTREPVGNGDGERVLGAVRVEGAQGSPYFGGAGQAAGVNGINGSRDITATEGTGSFTSGALTIGSKVAQALKDVPQSISVLTSERLAQQNVTDFTTAMRQLPGITLVQGDTSLQTKFYSRGYEVTSVQIDGGAPLTAAPGRGFSLQIDMSMYDHVELLRGAAGLFNGYGDPGGTVNLVRKKPLDHSQYTIDAQAGNWSNYRVVADATSPLALDGGLRGRLVMTYQNNRHFYETAKDNKTLIYGIVELDLTPITVINAGISYTRQDSVPWVAGLPRYLNGNDLKLPRSVCLCFPWNQQNFETTEIFGGLEKSLGGDWTFTAKVTRNQQTSRGKVGHSSGAVNPENLAGALLRGNYYDNAGDQLAIEATASGSFVIFGQRQEVTFGVNRSHSDSGGAYGYDTLMVGFSEESGYRPYSGGPIFYFGSPNGPFPPVDVLHFNPNDPLYREPSSSLPRSQDIIAVNNQTVAYLNVKLTAFDRLHLTTGLRLSRFSSKWLSEQICSTTDPAAFGYSEDCSTRQIGDRYNRGGGKYSGTAFAWPPTITLSFDILKNLTAYSSYTDIYIDRSTQLHADRTPLRPIRGSNFEGGIKWAPKDGKLNIAVSFYKTRRNDGSEIDFSVPYGVVAPGVVCCLKEIANRIQISNGMDLDITGEILPGLQVAANYVRSETKTKGSAFGDSAGQTFLSIQPKALYKLWATYDFGAVKNSGALSGVALSLGANGQSSGYRSGYVCPEFTGTPDPIFGTQECVVDPVPYSFMVPAYVVLSGRVDYRLSKNWSLAVNLENILDKTYYQTVGDSPFGGHWYGSPRSVTATIRAKW
jgi:outer-membrane receptor for ferric coprogen and ferric-rhodotorulic acid